MQISRLPLRENAAADVHRMVGTNGPQTADLAERIGPDLEGLAERLSIISRLYRDGRNAEIGRLAREVAGMSQSLGLLQISRVAAALDGLASGRDPAALGANVARLLRLGDDALHTLWALHDAHY
ncbi:hypothetical protein LX81_02621 [Palleronia aestuarii]|uniref:Hpt domain-containing protein n=1 Tax=Palleronia aestuarii TaxID=568105 RepID=A0A2W7N5N3_9RHOB|nr:hypothetical protein [Palleronia aestuarii]PZX15033.1 hypothetical protein LX81_02621 [Palleronia aestuarii]